MTRQPTDDPPSPARDGERSVTGANAEAAQSERNGVRYRSRPGNDCMKS